MFLLAEGHTLRLGFVEEKIARVVLISSKSSRLSRLAGISRGGNFQRGVGEGMLDTRPFGLGTLATITAAFVENTRLTDHGWGHELQESCTQKRNSGPTENTTTPKIEVDLGPPGGVHGDPDWHHFLGPIGPAGMGCYAVDPAAPVSQERRSCGCGTRRVLSSRSIVLEVASASVDCRIACGKFALSCPAAYRLRPGEGASKGLGIAEY